MRIKSKEKSNSMNYFLKITTKKTRTKYKRNRSLEDDLENRVAECKH
jgi:hypothetical protein